MTVDLCLGWARDEAEIADPSTWARRLDSLRPFSRFLANIDPATRFPFGSPFGRAARRLAPHIYTSAEIQRIIDEAAMLRPTVPLRPATFATMFGLLAATGLRISEALSLQLADADLGLGQLTIRTSKFGGSRIVPLHPTTIRALDRYLAPRSHFAGKGGKDHFFTGHPDGRAIEYATAFHAFTRLPARNDIRPRGGHPWIRLHDLRHTFVCRRLMLWIEHGVDIDNAILALSTYVGHSEPKSTYWYMEAVPELMALTSLRFERSAQMMEIIDHA
jgi:integrase